MQQKRKPWSKLTLIAIFIFGISLYLILENNRIEITEFDYYDHKIPAAFDGFTIAQISDLHNKSFGKKQENILAQLKSTAPDIIVITGDLIDRRKYDLEAAVTFIAGASKIAPVYYVTGNHEAWLDQFEKAKQQLIESGIIFMDDAAIDLKRGDARIKLLGVSDPDFFTTSYVEGNDVSQMTKTLSQWNKEQNLKILLTHRPELLELYVENGMDLVFAGHAHGGQVRIPFIGALIAPDQGWLPKYTSGSYHMDITTMYVSRGLGNSILPIRINNRPEIVVVRLNEKP